MIRLRQWLAHPLTSALDIDDPRTTQLRRSILREKGFLRHIYQEWYRAIATALPGAEGAVLELGSGAGFLGDFLPDLITSELFPCADVRVVLDGLALPFANASLRGIVMTDVLHHISAPRRLFVEAARCVRPQGAMVLIEPWVTPWSRVIYTRLHHEPFCPEAAAWEFPPRGPLSGANMALPWMMFARDRAQFEREFPEWDIQTIDGMMPFRYLVSGGVSLRSLMPERTFGMWRSLEKLLHPWMDTLAMFARIVLRRTG